MCCFDNPYFRDRNYCCHTPCNTNCCCGCNQNLNCVLPYLAIGIIIGSSLGK